MSNKYKTETFIKKAKEIHGDKYDYSKVNYIKSKIKVIIICDIHSEFQQTPDGHLRGMGCRTCGKLKANNSRRSNTDKFIKNAKEIHGDKYDYSNTKYIKRSIKVSIMCNIHGEFLQTPGEHLAGCGCSKCGKVYKYATKEWIEQAKQIHGDIYDYSNVKYINAHSKVCIICNKHGKFYQSPNNHLSKQGCSKCGKEIIALKQSSNTDEFIERSKQAHGDKYDYSNVKYINAHSKVCIICNKHGRFYQSPVVHLKGCGCNTCGDIEGHKKTTSNSKEFIEKSIKIHGDKYDYSNVKYINSHSKVCIICNKHGRFYQSPVVHLRGCGCNTCAGPNSCTTENFIEKSIKIHGDKYDYSNVKYINNTTKICIICNKHGEFQQTPADHLAGCGCSKCNKKYSKKQIDWLNFISIYYNLNIQHAENKGEYTINNSNFKADGYCKENNTIYEFHGDLYHGNPEKYDKDYITYIGKTSGELFDKTKEREEFIKKQGYNLVVMWENDWKKINNSIKILQNNIKLKFL